MIKKIPESLFQLTFLACISTVSYLAFVPNYKALPELVSLSDLLNHFIAFFVLSLLLDQGFHLSMRQQIGFLLFYGLFIEIVQYFLPNRCFDLLDLLVDSFGVAVYWMIRLMKVRY